MKRLAFVCAVVFSFAAHNLACAYPDPWPDYSSHTQTARYVCVLPVNSSGTVWDYFMSIDSGASDPVHGAVQGVKALAVYPNGGDQEPQLDGWTGYAVNIRGGWNDNGGWQAQRAFGYLTGSPVYYILPGEANEFIGAAEYPQGYRPPDQRFLVHVVYADSYTSWARPAIVPEPGLSLLLLTGAIPLTRLFKRRSRA